MKTPVFNALKEKLDQNYISFHTPGHKGKNALINWAKYLPAIDTSEIQGMDNLLDPQGIIKESQDYAAKVYGTKATYYSVNGSTGSIHIALATISKPGDKVLVQRNCHKAVFNGIILNRLEPVYISPIYDEENKLTTVIDPDELDKKLKEHSDIRAVIITYPDYYGICSDIESIVDIVHRHGAILMVDEAHGSHFNFSPDLPKSAIDAGADIVVQSIHKTLPSLTQTSLIHVCSDKIDLDRLRKNYQLYMTTSPSYLFILSCEGAIAYMDDNREKLNQHIDQVKNHIKRLESIEGVNVYKRDNKDITKILFSIHGYRGQELLEILHNEYRIDMEMADPYYLLALTSIMNQEEDFNRLYEAIKTIARNSSKQDQDFKLKPLPEPEMCYTPYDAYHMESEKISLDKSAARISAATIIPYPPGIPLIVPGEVLSHELLDYISWLKDLNIEISGLLGYNKDYIEVIKERC